MRRPWGTFSRRPSGSGLIRGECLIEGCHYKQKRAGKTKDGRPRYKALCQYHLGIRYGMSSVQEEFTKKRYGSVSFYKSFPNNKCSICGWNKAYCDRHRIKNGKEGGKYTKGNVVSLCPNCHRLVHLEKINL